MASALAVWLAVPLLAACCGVVLQSAEAAEPDRRMEELERRMSELERKLLAREGDPARTDDSSEKIAGLDRRVKLIEGRLRTHGSGVLIRGPLEVTDARGNAILRVGDASPDYAGAAVSILNRGDLGGTIFLYRGDKPIVSMGSSVERNGRVVAIGSDGSAHVTMDGATGLSVYASADAKVASLSATTQGAGTLTLSNSNSEVAFAEISDKVGLMLWAKNERSVQLGPGRNGNTALRIYNPAGTLAAVLGVDPGRDNTGTLIVYDSKGTTSAAVMGGDRSAVVVAEGSSGNTVAQMAVSAEERGIFQVFNSGVSIAALTKGARGGMLQLASDEGRPMVEAGVNESGHGTFRAGPMYKCTPAQAILAELPDCLAGRD